MQLAEQLLGSAIPMLTNLVILLYICQRFLAATMLRRRIIAEMREFSTIVRRARDNLRYIGERVTKGMDEIKEDIGKELRVTDRLTTQSSKLEMVLRRFASLEENVIEMVRMDRNRESVRIETPMDVGTEIERIVAAAERRSMENREDSLMSEVDRREGARNPVSKFSACGPRENIGRKAMSEGRARIVTTPEVRLLGEPQPKK